MVFSRPCRTRRRIANRRFKVELFHAALLHDIGKVGVRDSILLKPGKLDGDEFRSLCTHPVKAFKILRHFEFLRESLEFIRHHHERPDGKGYPDKLRGNRIPHGALIIGVADGFDAMTSNRPYRKSLGFEAAIREIAEHRGTQFDRNVAEAFLAQMTLAVHQEVSLLARRPLETTAKEVFARL
ncbi:MAG: HD-GYP domain-containing protein [Candidatus Methylomirabilia bacterium]